jgi:hypothetical protein
MSPTTVARARQLLVLLVALTGAGFAVTACVPEERPGASDTAAAAGVCVDKDRDGYGVGCGLGPDCNDDDPKVTNQCRACLTNEPGCSCASEGQRIECGKVSSKSGDQVRCILGGQICQKGVWSACTPGTYAAGHDGYLQTQTLNGPSAAGGCNDCDPHCHLFADTPDNLDGGGLLPDGGFAYSNINGSGTPSAADITALQVSGGVDGGLFKVLLPGQTSDPADNVTVVDPRPAGGDVYFLLDDTSSMGAVAQALETSIAQTSGVPCVADPASPTGNGKRAAAGGGIVENLKCKFGDDVFIGFGRFEDYWEYWGGSPGTLASPGTSLPYQHLLSMQLDALPAQNAAVYARSTAYLANGSALRTGGDIPEALVPSLYAAISGRGLVAAANPVASGWWATARSTWTTSWAATPLAADKVAGGCPAGRTGYPCFRNQTTPIFVVFTDAPSHNGPGGQFGYPNYTMGLSNPSLLIPGAAASPRTNAAPNSVGNLAVAKTFAAANALEVAGDGLVPRLYWGTVTPNVTIDAVSSNPTALPSNSSILDGLTAPVGNTGRSSLRDCSNAQSTVTVSTSGVATTGMGSYDIPWPEAQPAKFVTAVGTGTCGGVTYTESCDVASPHVASSTPIATYTGALYSGTPTGTGTVRLSVLGQNTKPDGTTGTLVVVAPTAGSRVEYRLTMVDTAQRNPADSKLTVGGANVTVSGTSGPKTGNYYTTAANENVGITVKTDGSADVIVRVEWWIREPTLSACGGFVVNTSGNAPVCRTCSTGYAQGTGGNAAKCCGNDTPSCGTGTAFSSNTATGGCASPGTIPAIATARGYGGNCFACGAQVPAPETGRPATSAVVTRGGTTEGQPGCYIPSCSLASFAWPPGRATTAGGTGWQFDTGGTLASSGKCVLSTAAANLTCTAGSAPICASNPGLCNPYGATFPVALVSGGNSTKTSLCGCSNLNNSPLLPDHPTTIAATNGVTATYFASAPGTMTGWAVPLVTRGELNIDMTAVPTGVPSTNFSARWTGRIAAPAGCGGVYEFTTSTDDGARLWIDDRAVVFDGTTHGTGDWPANAGGAAATWQPNVVPRFNLLAGTKVNVKMEMFQGGSGYGAALRWRRVSGNCGGVTTAYTTVPTSAFTNDYVTPAAPGTRAQCLTQGSYTATSSTGYSKGQGGFNAESIYKFTVPTGKTFYYRFALLKNDRVGGLIAPEYSTSSTDVFMYLKREAEAVAADNTRVLDCNVSTSSYGSNAGVQSELNGKVGPGTYYLVIDNKAGSVVSSYSYLLQVNQFAEVPSTKDRTVPTYDETIALMKAQNAKLIGVENSGVSCGESNLASFAQYETRDHLEKLAIDTGSLDSTGSPIVVSLKRNAASCDGTVAAPASLTTKLNDAVNTLANTLRQDIIVRATKDGAAPSLATVDPANTAFAAEEFMGAVTADATSPGGRCGGPSYATVPVTAADFDSTFGSTKPARQMFQGCLPGAPVRFDVKFQVPSTIVRTSTPQYFRFDLAIQSVGRDGSGNKIPGPILARVPVVIKVPEGEAGTALVVRDYDANQACVNGYKAVWSGFGYNASTPAKPAGVSGNVVAKTDSKIEFLWSTADTTAGLAAPNSAGMNLFAVATRAPPLNTTNCTVASVPRTEACTRVDLAAAITAKGESPNKRYMRVQIKMLVSEDGAYVPSINDWKMYLDCIPNE